MRLLIYINVSGKAKKPLQGIEVKGKESGKDKKHIGKLIEKIPNISITLYINKLDYKSGENIT